jgi:hypothetical protein
MMCAATVNWTLFTDIIAPVAICDAQQHNWLLSFLGFNTNSIVLR